jgi:hypothetical protein
MLGRKIGFPQNYRYFAKILPKLVVPNHLLIFCQKNLQFNIKLFCNLIRLAVDFKRIFCRKTVLQIEKTVLTSAAATAHQNQYQGPHKLSHQALEQPEQEGQTGVSNFRFFVYYTFLLYMFCSEGQGFFRVWIL